MTKLRHTTCNTYVEPHNANMPRTIQILLLKQNIMINYWNIIK